MNLQSLYYFVELARELHVTHTAQKLYISQQNLSQHIQKLEQYYGVTLFNRKPKMTLTYAGEQLLAVATKILAEENELINRLSNISTNRKGHLKVGIPGYRGQICLPEILPPFYEKWPNVSIDLVSESSGIMEKKLFDGELDLFIGIMYQDKPKLKIESILNDQIYLVCSDRLLQQYFFDSWEKVKRESLSGVDLKEFAKVPFLMPKAPMKLRRIVDQCFQEAGVVPEIKFETQVIELYMSLYSYDYGAFFCTQMRMPTLLAMHPDANAFPLFMNGEPVQHRLVAAYHEERFLPDYALDFISLTKQVLEKIAETRPQNQHYPVL